ncbi:hypothetical protein V5O48_007577 [Marasmius crinis-equi]|uniref:Uncharacterized protein n=1 Tax=Marasmius crinis-equi TaxID=585013 RepID=A0ABR3FGD8_9AGAR
MQLKLSLLSLLVTAASVSAAPSQSPSVTKRDVWSPPIISPDASTVWVTGGTFNVTWDNSNPPQRITPGNAIVLMNFNEAVFGSDGYTETIRALDSFSLLDGFAEVTVPAGIPADDQYFITRECCSFLRDGDSF